MPYTFPLVLVQEDAPATTPNPPAVGAGPGATVAPTGTQQITTSTGATTQPRGSGDAFGGFSMILMLGVVILFFFFTSRSSGKEKKRREAMIAAMKKGDKVLTIGGIYGSVVEVRDQDIILKIDENTNSRMRVTRAAVQAVVDDKEEIKAE